MTSNNLEAIELIKKAMRITTSNVGNHYLYVAVSLLQADEVEDPWCECGDYNPRVHHLSYHDDIPPKPTKETKLRELRDKTEARFKKFDYVADKQIIELIDILLEEEY